MVVLGIETSCDETSAAVVLDGRVLLSNVVASSMDLHKLYGGVVPEIAARSHIESITPVIDQALHEAFPNANPQMPTPSSDLWDRIDAIAVTYGAGLGGSLLVGVMTARTLAIVKNKPLYAVNHVHGHVAANFLTESELNNYQLPASQPEFPMLALIVSGNHTQLVIFRSMFDYTLLGKTRDDAIGEAFDKVAKITGLPYPGGPSIAQAALSGDPEKYKFPKPRLDLPYEFSFSGLKTAVLRQAQQEIGEDFTFPSKDVPSRLSEAQKADIAASFQRTAVEIVVDKAAAAIFEFQPKSFVIAGGVAANTELRVQLSKRLATLWTHQSLNTNYLPPTPSYTDIKLCTDNGAMTATLGCFMAMENQSPADPYSLDIQPNLSM